MNVRGHGTVDEGMADVGVAMLEYVVLVLLRGMSAVVAVLVVVDKDGNDESRVEGVRSAQRAMKMAKRARIAGAHRYRR